MKANLFISAPFMLQDSSFTIYLQDINYLLIIIVTLIRLYLVFGFFPRKANTSDFKYRNIFSVSL